MTAASPGIIATTMLNAHYDSHERYVMAIAEQMKKEYEYIYAQGLLLQLDAPDLAMERTFLFQDLSIAEFQKIIETHIEAVNIATENIPADRIRLHICWGNYDGPHNHDVPLVDILPILYQAQVGALALELANPRHQHEHKTLRRYPLPETMLLIPGVIDSTTNYIEHPEIVADRICQVVEAVGERSRVIAGSDCGFGTFGRMGDGSRGCGLGQAPGVCGRGPNRVATAVGITCFSDTRVGLLGQAALGAWVGLGLSGLLIACHVRRPAPFAVGCNTRNIFL